MKTVLFSETLEPLAIVELSEYAERTLTERRFMQVPLLGDRSMDTVEVIGANMAIDMADIVAEDVRRGDSLLTVLVYKGPALTPINLEYIKLQLGNEPI